MYSNVNLFSFSGFRLNDVSVMLLFYSLLKSVPINSNVVLSKEIVKHYIAPPVGHLKV